MLDRAMNCLLRARQKKQIFDLLLGRPDLKQRAISHFQPCSGDGFAKLDKIDLSELEAVETEIAALDIEVMHSKAQKVLIELGRVCLNPPKQDRRGRKAFSVDQAQAAFVEK